MYKVPAARSPYYTPPVGGITFGTLTTESANARTLSMQFNDAAGVPLTKVARVGWYLSTAADGSNFASAATSVLAGTNGLVQQAVTGVSGQAITNATGQLDMTITDPGVRTDYLIFVMPDGTLVPSPAIAFA